MLIYKKGCKNNSGLAHEVVEMYGSLPCGLGFNPLTVATQLFPGVSCLVKIQGSAGGPSFEPESLKWVRGFVGIKKKEVVEMHAGSQSIMIRCLVILLYWSTAQGYMNMHAK